MLHTQSTYRKNILVRKNTRKNHLVVQKKTGGETEKMSETITEKIEFPEIMPVNTELISEPIIDTSEIIGTNTEKIDEWSWL